MRRHLRVHLVAVGLAVVAMLLGRLIWPLIDASESPLFLAAVVVSAWYGGLAAGLVTTAVAVPLKLYFVLPPTGTVDVDDIVTLLVFVLLAVIVGSLTGALRRAEAANRALADEERAARAEAEAANRAKDVFLAKISHELRAPLQATSGWAHLLDRVRGDEERFAAALAALHRGIAAQVCLLDDLLAASRIIAGKMRLDLGPVALAEAVESAVRTACAAAPQPQPPVRAVVADPHVIVRGDRARLEQVVVNLVGNALKFTPPEGRVEVRLERGEGMGRLVVTDTGRGIAPSMLPHLFDEFAQATDDPSGLPGGLGLGLAIVRQLVHLHGGTVRAESEGPGRGATFTVELPLAAAGGQPDGNAAATLAGSDEAPHARG
ncbi:MAG TPA: HAMP domain-containing sensor histidine kinase [Candidatus Tectomicrobia bacterium]|nr:HAMP domain-containing sensor histidine kinase [Candidatus Tectomicrobia bacterium]